MSKQKVPEVQQNELLDQIDLDEDKICWHDVQIKKQSSDNVPWGTETRIVLVQHQLTLVWQWNIVNARKINLDNDQNLLTKNIWVPADPNISAFRPVYVRWNCLIFKVMFMKLGNLSQPSLMGKSCGQVPTISFIHIQTIFMSLHRSMKFGLLDELLYMISH